MKDLIKKRFDEKFLYQTPSVEAAGYSVILDRKDYLPTAYSDMINFIEQIISERDKEVIKMLENTDVQMSVNGSVSQDEIAMAKFIYKAHIKHIIKKIESAIIPPNSINGTLPSETDSATI